MARASKELKSERAEIAGKGTMFVVANRPGKLRVLLYNCDIPISHLIEIVKIHISAKGMPHFFQLTHKS